MCAWWGELLHWLLSVELIIHMVGGKEWKPPTAKKKKKGKSKDMASREQVAGWEAVLHLCSKAPSDEGDHEFLQTQALKNNIHPYISNFFFPVRR